MKKIIWALFDDGNSCYKNAIKNENIEVHNIGINNISMQNYHKIDLSLLNDNLFKQLDKLPKPNIILASPPCESWSCADCGGRMFRNIKDNCLWLVKNKQYYIEYNKVCNPVKRRNFIKKETNRIIGETTIGATLEIINKYNPNVWVIENPQSSKIWDYIKYHHNFNGINNITYYSTYDNSFSLKPTNFLSNINLNLRKDKIRGNKDYMKVNTYNNRSNIPYSLINNIIEEIIKYETIK